MPDSSPVKAGPPRFSLSISGPPIFSISAGIYPLTVTLHYHAAVFSHLITFNLFGTPLHVHASLGSYHFYRTAAGHEGEVADVYPTDFEIDDSPVPVLPENDFATVSPGQGTDRLQRQLELPAESYGLFVGERYRLLLPSGVINWWDYGPMEVRVVISTLAVSIFPNGEPGVPGH